MFLNKTSEKVLDHFRHQENKHQLKTKDSMANTQTLVKKSHTLLTERKMSAKHSPMKAKPENIRKKDKMSSKRGKKNPTVSHKTALTYKTSKAIYEGKMSCTIAERLRSMDLNKPTLKAKQHEGLQTFMAEDSAPICEIKNDKNRFPQKDPFTNISSFQKLIKLDLAPATTRASEPLKCKVVYTKKRKSIKPSSLQRKLSRSIKRDCKSSQNLYLNTSIKKQKKISTKRYTLIHTPQDSTTPFSAKGSKRSSSRMNPSFSCKKSPVDYQIECTFTESVKQAEKMLRTAKNIELIKNEDSTNSSDTQKVKTVLENYYKEDCPLEMPVDRKQMHETLDEEEEDAYYRDLKTVLPEDLQVMKKIGSGTFARVFLCKSMKTQETYALKVIDKKKLKNKDLIRYAVTERKILQEVKSDFVVSLKLSFQTKSHCYLLMDYCPGQDICTYLDKESSFSEDKARFYLSEIVAAIHALHKNGVIHRDLKPNNIMLDSDGHIKLIDFNLCKTGIATSLQRTKSYCGTPAYMAPEVLSAISYGRAIDWYLVGVILYEMVVGIPPFFQSDISKVHRGILRSKLEIPVKCSDECKDLLHKLLCKNPSKRLGNMPHLTNETGAGDVLAHPWFKGITLEQIEAKELHPYIPYLKKSNLEMETSLSPKEQKYLETFNENLKNSLLNKKLKRSDGKKIQKWTFIQE
ncbi:unnamed protein product [Moneuplotes crassus]|uniref:non-specific serine/threonine protein kinase n=1 Tax=Euplotes crassus TaxID=5936 RepID=A0AAD1XJH1_EUPCR|nr:unnamed protein product [Moneuplotes crassus]